MQQYSRLLIPIGIQLHPPLLHQDPAEMFGDVERQPGKIAFHDTLLIQSMVSSPG
jgi:hypothetical protein